MYKAPCEKKSKKLTEVLGAPLVLLWLVSPFFKRPIMLTHFTGDRHFYHRPLHLDSIRQLFILPEYLVADSWQKFESIYKLRF
jgi:hypothetical protein